MDYTYETTKSGVKVYQENIHVKTIPAKYQEYFDKAEISFEKKRLNGKERF